MSNLFIKYPADAKRETIVNLQNLKFIEKDISTENHRVYFHTSNEDYFFYESKNKKTRDDFFEAILQKLSLNNNIENTEKEILNSFSANKILYKAFLNYKKRLKD
mgnify:CR=1 FL=1|jgi:hypothetical protein